ncbi:MAG: SusD/RagB family nutrient-binding outer membrane lipoprotein [Candidatus Dadabacteria bacterium]
MKQRISFILIILVILTSCSKNLPDVNKNPNSPSQVEADFLLTTSIFESMNLYGGQMNRAIFYNYTHHYSGFQGEFQRYNYNQGENSGYWRNTYIRSLQPVHQVVVQYGDRPTYKNRVLIARIWMDYIFSNAVSMWGSVPTTEALDGTPSVPYQKEQDIYYFLLNDLHALADSINLTGDKYTALADKIYGGDLLKWKKFANTLRLRLAMRISAADPATAQKEVADIYTKDQYTMKTEAETATAVWGSTSDSWSPLYDRVVYNYTANKATIPVINESLIYHMAPYNDPRLPVYAQPAKQGPMKDKYFGQNVAYGGGAGYARYPNTVNPHTGLKQDDYSYIGARFLKPDAEYVFLSYAEACFLKAEAALKGWWGNTNASQYYYEGIDASILRYGLTSAQATAYKNTPGIKWGVASDTTGREAQFQDWLRICSSYVPAGDYMRQVIMQHWLAIPGQGVDAWALLRRTQILEFEPQFATYDGDYKYMPQRILYPSDELQTNAAEVNKAIQWLGGPDDLFTKLWFAVPTKKNPFLPY